MLAPATAFYAVVLVVMKLLLVWRVIGLRRRLQVGLGDGGHRDLEVAIRCHSNFMEYMPLVVVLMFVAEMNGVAYVAIHGVGLLFVVSRAAHAVGLTQGRGRYTGARAFGMVGSWVALILLCILMLHNVHVVGLI